ncbi:MAG TPA: N-acetylneuraminate synthase, partial [Bacilli bacterium]|nr:N-acetylneuraminate synthase [Bacilli bacterium]
MKKTFIIAEAGVNHNGSLQMAKELIDVATEAGADAVKFQTFRAGELASEVAPKAEYQLETTSSSESQFEMLKKLELTVEAHQELIDYCREKNIQFLSTPFDFPSVKLLTETFDLPIIKIPSGEITNAPLLLEIAKTKRKIILSTGMSTLGEIEQALSVLAYGLTSDCVTPSLEAFNDAFCSTEGQEALIKYVSLLHCTTEYPTPFSEVNLRVIDTLAQAFGLPVGFSDHTVGITAPIAAVARGATIIEKHFTLDRNLPGPDHKASLEPRELTGMVKAIRETELALGQPYKIPTVSEQK